MYEYDFKNSFNRIICLAVSFMMILASSTLDVQVNGEENGIGGAYPKEDVNKNQEKIYKIHIESIGNGRVSPSGAQSVKGGDTLILEIEADPGYLVSKIKVDTSTIDLRSILADNKGVVRYKFKNVWEDHMVKVAFTGDDEESADQKNLTSENNTEDQNQTGATENSKENNTEIPASQGAKESGENPENSNILEENQNFLSGSLETEYSKKDKSSLIKDIKSGDINTGTQDNNSENSNEDIKTSGLKNESGDLLSDNSKGHFQEDLDTGVYVKTKNSSLESGYKLKVNRVGLGQRYNVVLSILGEKDEFYNVSFQNDEGSSEAPMDEITVGIPIPTGFNLKDVQEYVITDGTGKPFKNSRIVCREGKNYFEFESGKVTYNAIEGNDQQLTDEEKDETSLNVKTKDNKSQNISDLDDNLSFLNRVTATSDINLMFIILIICIALSSALAGILIYTKDKK